MIFTKEFLVDLHSKNYPINECIEIAKYLYAKQTKINLPGYKVFNIAGTGGSQKLKINLSTILAKKLSKKFTIIKNGNKAVTGSVGGFNILESANYKICHTILDVTEEVNKNNLAYIFMKSFNPVYQEVSDIRSQITHLTIFNLLGPLINSSLQIKGQVMGVSQPEIMEKIALIASELNLNVMLVHDQELKIDEISIAGKTKIIEVLNNKIKEYYIEPENFGIKRNKNIAQYFPKNIDQAKLLFYNLLKEEHDINPLQDYVNLNYMATEQFYLKCL